MGENTDTGILREIDEELRQEHYSKLWKRYGTGIIALGVLLVVSVAAYKGWQSYDISQRTEASAQFSAALNLIEAGNATEAQAALATLAANASGGYKLMSTFRSAAILAVEGQPQQAIEAYETIASDSDIDQSYRDLATVLSISHQIDTAAPDTILSRLTSLTVAENPWRHSARELRAIAAIRMGDLSAAKQTLSELSIDTVAPQSIRSRAQELLLALGNT